jgi:excisionase family DNA binding protein
MHAAENLMPIWLTKGEAADRARVTTRTIEKWIKRGWLRAGGAGKVVRIKPEWVDECLESLHDRDPGK